MVRDKYESSCKRAFRPPPFVCVYQTLRSVLPYIKPRLSSSWLQLSLSPIPSTFLPPHPLFHPTWWNPGLQASGSTYSSFSLSSLLPSSASGNKNPCSLSSSLLLHLPPSFHLYHHTETTQQAHSSSHDPTGCLSSQLHIQWHHVGSLKSSVAGVFTRQTLASTINPAFLLSKVMVNCFTSTSLPVTF